jgi:hypothetical protein
VNKKDAPNPVGSLSRFGAGPLWQGALSRPEVWPFSRCCCKPCKPLQTLQKEVQIRIENKIRFGARTLGNFRDAVANLAGSCKPCRRRCNDDEKFVLVPARFVLFATGRPVIWFGMESCHQVEKTFVHLIDRFLTL